MSINAINGISLYEYYYKINKEKQQKDNSPIAKEMKKYGLTPTDDESLNVAMLKRAKQLSTADVNEQKEQIAKEDRPWADIMYQLDLSFSEDPADDIENIKKELKNLMIGVVDEELQKEIDELESNVTQMYIDFQKNDSNMDMMFNSLGAELNNLSMLNKTNFI